MSHDVNHPLARLLTPEQRESLVIAWRAVFDAWQKWAADVVAVLTPVFEEAIRTGLIQVDYDAPIVVVQDSE